MRQWIKDWSDVAFGFLIGVVVILLIFTITGTVRDFIDDNTNAIEGSSLFAGYSEIEVYEVFDSSNGVMYAVTEEGDICLMVNPDGTPKMVD